MHTPVQRWMGHNDMITSLQFDGFKLVTGGMDCMVKVLISYLIIIHCFFSDMFQVWDVRTSRLLYSIASNEGGVRCLQFCGSDLVLGGGDSLVMILRYLS